MEKQHSTIAVISYITFIGLLIAYIMNTNQKNKFSQYHIHQSLGLQLCFIFANLLNFFPILGSFLSLLSTLFLLYMLIMGIINALNKKEEPLPFLGNKFEEWFAGI